MNFAKYHKDLKQVAVQNNTEQKTDFVNYLSNALRVDNFVSTLAYVYFILFSCHWWTSSRKIYSNTNCITWAALKTTNDDCVSSGDMHSYVTVETVNISKLACLTTQSNLSSY